MAKYPNIRCSKCAVEIEAGCNCNAPYMPAGKLAEKRVREHPEKTNRLIASEIHVHPDTVDRARKRVDAGKPKTVAGNPATESEKRKGKDGKEYQARKLSAASRAKEAWGVSVDISRVKTTPPEYVKLTEEMITEYEKDLEMISQIQMELIKFGVNADQLHPLRRLKYASQLKGQKDMWEMLAKNMIGKDGKNDKGESVNLRNVKSPHCNIEVPLFKEA